VALTASPDEVAARAAEVRERIARAGGTDEVALLAVTKGFGPEVAVAAAKAGLTDLGENYAQELLAKAPIVADEAGRAVRWHAIGRLQRNKVRSLAEIVDLWQTVDRPELADAIARHAPGARVLVQVNASDEPQKGGCEPGEVDRLVEHAVGAGLDVVGLMTVGRTGAPSDAAAGFALVRGLVDRLGLAVCSMGMSGDLEVAVAEGSTMVRVGTALFGERPPRST
jgi:pyridoxal phosphate enzyme (YggS family)